MLQSQLLANTVQLAPDAQVLFLNSAADPFVAVAAQQLPAGSITLAEDNIAALQTALHGLPGNAIHRTPTVHVAFHEYTSCEPAATMDCAILTMLYQPGNAWIHYGLALAAYALRPGGYLYVAGAKDRGILTIARHMQERFGNVETLEIHKGQRVVRAQQPAIPLLDAIPSANDLLHAVFAQGKLDEGTRLLMEALDVHDTDDALDIGCGAGYLGLHIARLAIKGSVTMVDASLAAVAMAQRSVEQSSLSESHNVQVLPGDGVQAVSSQRFDLIVTNPPFHAGGIQTTAIAERFIHGAAQVLRPGGRFYLVANRFLKYEPVLRECFGKVEEVGGDGRYKVLRATP
ncbi:MAG TPA: class I SAM-dependent methyltransferase [Ktedonobacteraceae bacterium]|nr:class I SAM-dependent methyltransferase [Ktedonobacteraceae bacterium]